MKDNRKYAYCVMLLYNYVNGDINMRYHTLMCSVESEREISLDDGSISKEYDVIPMNPFQEPKEYEFNERASTHAVSTIYEDYSSAREKCQELNQKYDKYKTDQKVLSYRRF